MSIPTLRRETPAHQSITVTRTNEHTVLQNMPRDLSELAKLAPRKGFFARLFG